MPPQVDLETLVSACAGGGSDRKIACETLIEDNNTLDKEDYSDDDDDDDVGKQAPPPDFPPESFWLSKDAELDWFDRNAFLERKESAKGINSNPNSTAHPNLNPGPNSSSQRFLKSKASLLFGLPKTQKMNYWKSGKPGRLFPVKRTEPIEKVVAEPSSPKVSCMGRVRSKRGCRKSSSSQEKPVDGQPGTGREKRKTGFYSRVLSIFRSNRSQKPARKTETEPVPIQKSVMAARMRDVPISAEPVAEPPGLGGMRRLSSARKSESWAADEIKSAISEVFETEWRRGHH